MKRSEFKNFIEILYPQPIRYVKLNKDGQYVHVLKISLEVLHIVDQSVFLAMIVHKLKLVYVKSVKIHASILVDKMLSAMLLLILLIAAANKDIKETHSWDVVEFLQ